MMLSSLCVTAQEKSIAREWNELLLESIRNDFARPTVHARNLFHASIAMYDSWALFDETAVPYLIGREQAHFKSIFDESDLPLLIENKDIDETISFAVYRIILHRYADAPGFFQIKRIVDQFMIDKGYDIFNFDFEYSNGEPASLGNFIGSEIIKYGLRDGANEQYDYENEFYTPINDPLNPVTNSTIIGIDPNRWQPLFFSNFIDQSGNPTDNAIPAFLSPEWGNVESFAIDENDVSLLERDEINFSVCLDPGPPPLLGSARSEEYKWGFSLVAHWSAQLDPEDDYLIDISPASIGNLSEYPSTFEEYKSFYKEEGGDASTGHDINPQTGQPYNPQMVPRGDYARVLAEFWADGPDSETPPGHWFAILNYVMDQPEFERLYNGSIEMPELEYDVKAYFTLGGAMHDAAIAAWSVKGYYDYIRPISALRYMASLGQSSDPNLPSYHEEGILLKENFIELIAADDPQFTDETLIGKIKIRAWRGPDYIEDDETDYAGVGWILSEDWWPYQRPSFVTPPFAGYVSGHSTYSRAAADVLTYLTGDPFFPGGMGTFEAKQNEFLVFEDGPSMDVVLQWATYQDASDQCSLSRIWGGIHPPADDIPGRQMGAVVGSNAIDKANDYFQGTYENEGEHNQQSNLMIYPNPIVNPEVLHVELSQVFDEVVVLDAGQRKVYQDVVDGFYCRIPTENLSAGVYFLVFINGDTYISERFVVQ